ncbi:MAG: hypothetical protein ACXWNG_05070 [Candidatus Limnocylindrales bacterium]
MRPFRLGRVWPVRWHPTGPTPLDEPVIWTDFGAMVPSWLLVSLETGDVRARVELRAAEGGP